MRALPGPQLALMPLMRRRFSARHTGLNSAWTFSSPLRLNCLKPCTLLIHPRAHHFGSLRASYWPAAPAGAGWRPGPLRAPPPLTDHAVRLVQQHAPTFFAQARDAARADLPQFVKDEFDAFLKCGILAHGVMRSRHFSEKNYQQHLILDRSPGRFDADQQQLNLRCIRGFNSALSHLGTSHICFADLAIPAGASESDPSDDTAARALTCIDWYFSASGNASPASIGCGPWVISTQSIAVGLGHEAKTAPRGAVCPAERRSRIRCVVIKIDEVGLQSLCREDLGEFQCQQ